jgi:hypothetical protein
MKQKPFTIAAIVLLAMMALMQLIRFICAWPVLINGVAIPVGVSAFVFVLTAGLAFMLWRENGR